MHTKPPYFLLVPSLFQPCLKLVSGRYFLRVDSEWIAGGYTLENDTVRVFISYQDTTLLSSHTDLVVLVSQSESPKRKSALVAEFYVIFYDISVRYISDLPLALILTPHLKSVFSDLEIRYCR